MLKCLSANREEAGIEGWRDGRKDSRDNGGYSTSLLFQRGPVADGL